MTVPLSGPMDNLKNHPYVRYLLETNRYDISYPYHDVGKEREEYSLTAGILIQEERISPSPMVLTLKQDIIQQTQKSEMFVFYHLGPRICGHKGIIHGGLVATLLDESLCRCGFQVLPNQVGVTASLNIQYCSPTPANSYIVLKASTTAVEGRKVWVEGSTNVLPNEEDYDPEQELITTSKADLLAIEPKWASKLTERGTNNNTAAATTN